MSAQSRPYAYFVDKYLFGKVPSEAVWQDFLASLRFNDTKIAAADIHGFEQLIGAEVGIYDGAFTPTDYEKFNEDEFCKFLVNADAPFVASVDWGGLEVTQQDIDENNKIWFTYAPGIGWTKFTEPRQDFSAMLGDYKNKENEFAYSNISSANVALPLGTWWGYMDNIGIVTKIRLNCNRAGLIRIGIFLKTDATAPTEVLEFTSIGASIQVFTLNEVINTNTHVIMVTEGVNYFVETNNKCYQIFNNAFSPAFDVHMGISFIVAVPTYSTVTDFVMGYVNGMRDYLKTREIWVAKAGGDFTSINSAIVAAREAAGSFVIRIFPGTYLESVKAKQMTGDISLIGVSKELCIIRMNYSDYYNPPLDVSGQIYIEGLTFKSTKTLGSAAIPMYSVHADFPGAGVTEFFNCNFENSCDQHTIGAGSWANQTLRFRNCRINETGTYIPTVGALYWHNNAEMDSVMGQRLEVIGCEIYSDNNRAVHLHDATQEYGKLPGQSEVTFISNVLYPKSLGIDNAVLYTYLQNNNFCGDIDLNRRSFGNNVTELNHT